MHDDLRRCMRQRHQRINFVMLSFKERVAEMGFCRRQPDDIFFEEGDRMCGPYKRYAVYDIDEEELCHEQFPTISCQVPGCILGFDTLLDYELHYNSVHRYACSECKKRLPSAHLLDLHITESHDSFFAVQAAKKPMYQCFLQECKVKFNNADERRKHCIDTHKFPSDFRFDEARKKKPQSRKQGAKKKTDGESMEIDSKHCTTMEVSQHSVSSCDVSARDKKGGKPKKHSKSAVPKEFSFGSGVPKAFASSDKQKGKHWHQLVECEKTENVTNIEDMEFSDLKETLPATE